MRASSVHPEFSPAVCQGRILAPPATTASLAAASRSQNNIPTKPVGSYEYELITTPEEIPSTPGVEVPDVELEATLADGKKVYVNALLVDNVRTAGLSFDTRYEGLSTRADLIVYNGHAGLGANVRALATKGKWVQGQYVIAFLNGCDTYTYIDSALADAHAAVNPDDPIGTKYVDIVTNVMPSFFVSMSNATLAMFRGLMSYDQPKTFVRIGQPPTKESWACRPFKTGSNETCIVELTGATPIHVMVRGWAPSSSYSLVGSQR